MKILDQVGNKRVAWIAAAALIGGLLVGGGGALLVMRSRGGGHGAAETVAKKKELYRCPMHPAVQSDKPGQCPVCHMDLQKVDEDHAPGGPSEADEPSNVSGRTSFTLSLEKQQLIGVATTPVQTKPLRFEVRATGKVAFDPDLFTALEEYRQAYLTQQQMESGGYEALKAQSRELVQSAKTRLRLMGLSEAQVAALGKNPGDSMSLLLPGGAVWIYAEVYEYEVGGLKVGQKIEVTSPSVPGKAFAGKIASISPIVNSPTRTIRVRAQVPDPSGVLRPDTFVNVRINVEYGERLAVPEDAILHSGHDSFAFVVKGKGRFEPRAVKLGVKANDFYEILSGLQEGESVVTSANFLIDSESRMRAALQTMSAPETGGHAH